MKSILWEDSDDKADRAVVTFLIEKNIVWNNEHKQYCVNKIMESISTTEWQQNYPNRAFVFCVYYSYQIHVADIQSMLCFQAIDLLAYLVLGKNNNDKFSKKIKSLFSHIYQQELQELNADVIRILRNNIAHTGLVEGVQAKMSVSDKQAIEGFIEKNNFTSIRLALHSLAAEFDYLTGDIVLRALGLGDEDFRFNLRPPQMSDYFIK